MISSKYGIVCNPIVETSDGETMGPIIAVNPAAIAKAEPCVWRNSQAVNTGTLLHFVNPNIPPMKIGAELELWQMWVHEALR